jgi:hypothetical protein
VRILCRGHSSAKHEMDNPSTAAQQAERRVAQGAYMGGYFREGDGICVC